MHRLPQDIDLSFLTGRYVDGVCFERGRLSLFLEASVQNEKGIEIYVQSKVTHHSKRGVIEWDCTQPMAAACSLLLLFKVTILRGVGLPDGSLKLEFSNEETVTIRDSTAKTESYRIWDGDTAIVV